MTEQMTSKLALVLTITLLAGAAMGDHIWKGESGTDYLWSNPANWENSNLPAAIDLGGVSTHVLSDGNTVIRWTDAPSVIDGGAFLVPGQFQLWSGKSLTIKSGKLTLTGGAQQIGRNNSSETDPTTVSIEGGTFEIDKILLGAVNGVASNQVLVSQTAGDVTSSPGATTGKLQMNGWRAIDGVVPGYVEYKMSGGSIVLNDGEGDLKGILDVGASGGQALFQIEGMDPVIDIEAYYIGGTSTQGFVFDATGVSAIQTGAINIAEGATLAVDLTDYTGGSDDLLLFDSTTGAAVNGLFATEDIVTPDGMTADVLYQNGDVVLSVVVPEPATISLLLAGGAIATIRRRRR